MVKLPQNKRCLVGLVGVGVIEGLSGRGGRGWVGQGRYLPENQSSLIRPIHGHTQSESFKLSEDSQDAGLGHSSLSEF